MLVQNWNAYPNFSRDEFVCKCGCGQERMDADFMGHLQQVRIAVGLPMIVTSGWRCDDYNAAVSPKTAGSPYAPHPTGKAVDIACFGGIAFLILRQAAPLFSGIGHKQHGDYAGRFLHLDTLTAAETGGLRPWTWGYK